MLHYEIKGEGSKSIVFIHGFLESNAMWKNIVPPLENTQAIFIELPGHGKSPLLFETLTLTNMAKAVIEVLDSLKVTLFDIVGHSLGGYTALYIADLIPDRMNKLVLFHSHPWADSLTKKKERKRVVAIIQYDKLLFIKEAIPGLFYKQERFGNEIGSAIEIAGKMEVEAIVQTLRAMKDREDNLNVLEQLGSRLSVIQGEFDGLIDAHKMETMTKQFNNQFYLIRGVGHMSHEERPKEIRHLLYQIFQS